MLEIDNTEKKFYASCFHLAKEDILAFEREDNGPINNVIIGIANHCYGVKLFDDQHGLSAEMFYINGVKALKGDIIQLDLHDLDYYELLLRFCMLLADDYDEVDVHVAFNTFQTKLRGFLEKIGFFTVTSLELEQFKGQNAVMMSSAPRGVFKIDLIDKKEYYREFFGHIVECKIEKGKEYVYLMVNTQTSLIKIGKSKNPGYRERTLHSQEPVIHLIAVWCCDPKIEKSLHAMFSHKRIRGEWFRLLISDLTKIEKFMKERTS